MADPSIRVTVCLGAAARVVREVAVQLEAGSHVFDAVRASQLLRDWSEEAVDALQPGLWGRKVPPKHVLRDGDRVELYRALTVDPKVARRERFSRQGMGRTGLFAKRRAGAKSGY